MNIIILTQKYPYDKGEVFLDTELQYTGENNIFIMPMHAKEDSQPRTLPANVTLLKMVRSCSNFTYIKRIILLLSRGILSDELRTLSKERRLSLFTIAKAISFFFNAAKESILIEKTLSENIINESTVLYSYWASVDAMAIILSFYNNDRISRISRGHGIDINESRHLHEYLPFRRFIYENLNYVFPISNIGNSEILRRVNRNSVHSRVCRLGTSYKGANPFIFHETLEVVSCSSIIGIKRVDLLFDILNSIPNVRIHWTHFGGGDLLDALLESISERCNKNLTCDIKGRTENENIMSFYEKHCVDLFINVSTTEGIPVSIMEAMSFGIPVIATNVGGNGEIVDNNCGWLVDSDNTKDAVIDAVLEYISLDYTQRLHLRRSSFGKWLKEYNAEKNYKEFYSLLEDSFNDNYY